ncbi:MAG: cadherin-like domain-containing protein [Gammaproteobacteria bacterium]|nr:cadherin-like domain-containing protein [Gammaproteobacteria bacterium]
MNPVFQTLEDESVSFDVIPVTSELFLATLEQPANGEITSAGVGRYLYVPEKHFNGRDVVGFTLSDNTQGTITFEVMPVNDAPLAGDDVIVSIDGEKVTIPVLFNDVEFDTADSLRISSITQPDRGEVVNNGDGTVDFSPPENFVGTVRFSYEVSDLSSASDRADVDVFVISGEARLTGIELTPAVLTLQQGAPVQFKAVATFADMSSADITTVTEWTSSDPTLLRFSDMPEARGLATAKARGSVSVSASFNGISVSTTTVNILSEAPAAPVSVTGKYVGEGVIALDWSAAAADVDHYNIYWFTANQRTQVISRVTPPFQHTGNTLGITYYYTVRAVNVDGLEGKPSTRIGVKPQALSVESELLPPAEVEAVVIGRQIELSWQAADNAESYVLYWSNTLPLESASANRIELTGAAFVHENLDNGRDYHYVIASANADTESVPGTVFSVTLSPDTPALTAEAGDASVTLSWDAVIGADAYRLYWSITLPVVQDDSRRFEIAATDPLTINHDGLNNGEAYHYLILAVNKGGESLPGLATAVPMSIQEPPAPPGNINATLNSDQIELDWAPVDNASYTVYWSTESPIDIAVAESVSVTSPGYILQNILPATRYYFVVSTLINNVEGVPSSPEIELNVPPDMPEVSARGGKQQVILTWNGVTGADGYIVYWAEKDRAGNAGAALLFDNVISVDMNDEFNTYTHDNLINGNTYYYVVTAHYNGEESDGMEVRAIPRDYTVTKTEDTADGSCDADCSLREAIIAANTTAGKETIIVPPGTYILSIPGAGEQEGLTGDLDISDDFILLGDDAATTIIDANNLDRALDLSAGTGHIANISVRNGFAGRELGGGIHHRSGELRIDNSIITGNRSEQYGGGIANRGAVECARGSDGGLGALGGGCPVLTINNSVLSDNCADGSGSAVENFGLLTLNNSTVSANGLVEDVCSDAFGVIHTQYGVTFIHQSTLIDNTAGSVLSEWNATVVITNSTIANNQTRSGAVAAGALGKLSLINSTVSGNKNEENQSASFGATLEMANTLVAGNVNANNAISDCSAIIVGRSSPGTASSFVSLGNNLIGDSITDCDSFLALEESDLTGDAGLGVFVDNGTPGGGYYPLLDDSQAVDAGGSEYCSGTDQRGNLRPADGNGDTVVECDIGAFELAAKASNRPPLVVPMAHAIGGDAQVTLMWNGVSGAVSYNIYWAENDDVVPSSSNVIKISSRSASNLYVHEPLNNGSTYFYLIKAVSSDGKESPARQVSAVARVPEFNGEQ